MPQIRTSNVDSNQIDSNQQASSLNDRLNKHLLAYLATAGAAGVSMLAMNPSADAEVVYTPTHRAITARSQIDLNNDGIADYAFHSNLYICGTCGYFEVQALKVNKLMSNGAPLAVGVSVGPDGEFRRGAGEMINWCTCSGHPGTGGPWVGIQNGYMGFEFNITGAAHFGWARFSVTDEGAITLTGYAYETVPLKPIMTGDTEGSDDSVDQQGAEAAPALLPAGLGRLALGALGRAAQ
jgi:hypothetical protein